MTNRHVVPTTPDTTLATVWKCVNCYAQTNPFSDEFCPGMGLHAHISSESTDCDGRYSRTWVEQMNEDEAKSDFSDLDFKSRVLSNAVSFHELGTVEMQNGGFHANMQTEEGYRYTNVVWCEDICDDTKSTFRDHSAEAMGY